MLRVSTQIDNQITIEILDRYNPELKEDKILVEKRIKNYLDNYFNMVTIGRNYKEGYVIVSGTEFNTLEKVYSPQIEKIIDNKNKDHYIRYVRSLKFYD